MDYTYDLPMPDGTWTRGLKEPHSRLRRCIQIAKEFTGKPLSACRVLDLGCLDGQFALEFGFQGAEVVGIEFREAAVARAEAVRAAWKLDRVRFEVGLAQDVNRETYGEFDVILCSGLLYHLTSGDALALLSMLGTMSRLLILDTHVSATGADCVTHNGLPYFGHTYREFAPNATDEQVKKSEWSSAGNPTSFWFTRESLVNGLKHAGYSLVLECFLPGTTGRAVDNLTVRERGTFVAIRGEPVALRTNPEGNRPSDDWPEGQFSQLPRKTNARLTKWISRFFR